MKPAIYTSHYSKRHDTGHGHPENAARMDALEELFAEDIFTDWPRENVRAAELEQIILAHSEDYVFDLQEKTPDHGLAAIDGDTVLSPDSYDAALYAAGAVIQAVDMVASGERPPACGHDGIKKAFCAIRPPGHHAEPTYAMGFCLFNNIFVGARHAQEAHGFKKIAIIDFDVHHGNGTETMTRAHNTTHPDKPILYISSHGFPLFPMSGDPTQNDSTTLNIRLPDGCGSAGFRKLYEDQVFPALKSFTPDLLMISAGFDAHKDDPLASINLETEDYGWVTEELLKTVPNAPVISVLEGGYQPEALKNCARAHLLALAQDSQA